VTADQVRGTHVPDLPISREGGKRNAPSVAIDLGLNSVVALSNGFTIAAPRFYRQEGKQLGVFEQRGQKVRAWALAAKIANRRRHFLHVMSHGIVQQYGDLRRRRECETAGKDADGELRPRCRLVDAAFDASVQSDCAGGKVRNRLRTIGFPGLLGLRDDLPQSSESYGRAWRKAPGM
jgi:hypothetical protein